VYTLSDIVVFDSIPFPNKVHHDGVWGGGGGGGGGEGIEMWLHPILTLALGANECLNFCPSCFNSPTALKGSWYQLNSRLGGPHMWIGHLETTNMSSAPIGICTLDRQAFRLVAIPTALLWLPKYTVELL